MTLGESLSTPISSSPSSAITSSSTILITVIKLLSNQPVTRPYVCLNLGGRSFLGRATEDAVWNEAFEFKVSYHDLLFGACILDVYEARMLLPDRHIGRSVIHLRSLENFPPVFTNYYELWEKNILSLDVSLPKSKFQNCGALQLQICFNSSSKQSFCESPKSGEVSLSRSIPKVISSSSSSDEDITRRFFEQLSVQLGRQCLKMTRNEEDSLDSPYSPTVAPKSPFPLDKIATSNMELPIEQPLCFPDGPKIVQKLRRSGSEEIFEARAEDGAAILVKRKVNNNRTSWLDYLGSYTLGEDILNAYRAIMKLLSAFGQGFEISNLEMIASVVILEQFYRNLGSERFGPRVQSLRDVEVLVHFHRFSLASYGWRGLNFFGHGNGIVRDLMRKHSDVLSIREHLALQEDDLLSYDLHRFQLFRPSNYVAIDRRTNSIVLTIRGTMSAVDALTDLICEYHPWKGGLVHGGIKISAQMLLLDVIPDVIVHTQLHEIEEIIIVGHSLGAGTASVLAIMLSDLLPEIREKFELPPLSVHCYAFGPPCTVSLNLTKRYEHLIDAVIMDADIVAGLSFGSLMDWKAMILASHMIAEGSMKELMAYGGWQKISQEQWKERTEQLSNLRQRLRSSESKYPKLYIPGRLFQIFQATKEAPMEMRLSDTEEFGELRMLPGMLTDHLPGNYDQGLSKLRETLMLKNLN